MRNLHAHGGLVLESLWRGHDTVAIFNALAKRGVDLFFVVGGYGTIRGATKIANKVALRNLSIASSPPDALSKINLRNVWE